MSETDDTDTLLLIPPDFFLIPSDSEDEDHLSRRRNYNYSLGKTVVNTLLSHVSTLEDRLSAIESQSDIQSLNSSICAQSPKLFRKPFTPPKYRRRMAGMRNRLSISSDNLRNYDSSSVQSTPQKPRYDMKSVPGTPTDKYSSFPYERGLKYSPARSNLSSRYDPSGNSYDSLQHAVNFNPTKIGVNQNLPSGSRNNYQDNFSDSTNSTVRPVNTHSLPFIPYTDNSMTTDLDADESSVNTSPEKQTNADYLNEIDEFLRSIKFIRSYMNKKKGDSDLPETIDSIINTPNFSRNNTQGTSNMKSLIEDRISLTKKLIPANEQNIKNTTTEIDSQQKNMYDDINTLLNSIESKKSEILELTRKSDTQQSDKHKNLHVSKSGENIGSVPDYGFGMRNIMHGEEHNKPNEIKKQSTNLIESKKSEFLELRRNSDTQQFDEYKNLHILKPGENINSVPDHGLGMRNIIHGDEHNKFSKIPNQNTNLIGAGEVSRKEIYEEPCIKKHSYIVGDTNDDNMSTLYTNKNTISNFSDQPQYDSYNTNDTNQLQSLTSGRTAPMGSEIVSQVNNSTNKKENHYKTPENQQNRLLESQTTYKQIPLYTSRQQSSKNVQEDVNTNSYTASLGESVETQTEQNKSVQSPNINGNLLSLVELWNQESNLKERQSINSSDSSKQIDHRLEEERLRRQHCEKLIEALQARLLESQEKIAVAVKVDSTKDRMIEKLRDTYVSTKNKLDQVQNENKKLYQELLLSKQETKNDIMEMNKKIQYYENELSKVLEVTRSSQVHAVEYQNQLLHLKTELETFKEDKRNMSENIRILESELEKKKHILSEIQNVADADKKSLNTAQFEIKKMSDEKCSLQKKLADERSKSSKLDLQIKSLQKSLDESRNTEKKLQADMQKLSNEVEKNKSELQEFYQKQVETVVKEKLKQFQDQLESAEKAMNMEIEAAQLRVAKTAALCMQETIEKHQLEIRLLEERHSEEIRLCGLRLARSERDIEVLREKLSTQNSKRAHLAKQLHALMESQWREALRILTSNGQSPMSGSETEIHKPDSSADIHRLLLLNLKDENFDLEESNMQSKDHPQTEKPTSDRMKFSTKEKIQFQRPSSVSETSEDIPFGNEGQLTYRLTDGQRKNNDNTPVSSRSNKNNPNAKECELQKFIKMLLDKSPGCPVGQKQKDVSLNSSETPTWQQTDTRSEVPTHHTAEKVVMRHNKILKRPWK